jgi:hypothetical protein
MQRNQSSRPLVEELEDRCVPSSTNGIAGSIPTYYDGVLQTINFKLMSTQATASLLAHNHSINIIYESTNAAGQPFTTVINALPAPGEGPGFNPLWIVVNINFSDPNFPPRQFTSDNDIVMAAMAKEITLMQTTVVYRGSVLGEKA